MHAWKYIYVFGSYTNLDTPPQFLPLGACAQGLPPLSPLIGASPRGMSHPIILLFELGFAKIRMTG